MPLAIAWEDGLTLSLMWFGQTGLTINRFEAGLSASVNRTLDYHIGQETSIDIPLSLQLFTVVWL